MSGLRDARLRKALESAPDADLRPDARTRAHILAAAHEAVTPSRAAAWWQTWWDGMGSRRTPWNAAFATIALATLVTVIWHDREVPGARPDMSQPERPAAAAPVPAEAPVAAPSAGPQAGPAAVPIAVPSAAPVPQPARTPAARTPPSRKSAVRDEDTRALAKAAPQAETSSAAADAATGSSSREARPAPALAPAPAPSAPAALGRAAAPAARMTMQLQASPVDSATHVRLVRQGRATVEASLEHPSSLADLLGRVVREARTTEALEAPVDARIELRRQEEATGVLELAGAQVRWTASRGGESVIRTARPDAVLLEALRDELNRLPR